MWLCKHFVCKQNCFVIVEGLVACCVPFDSCGAFILFHPSVRHCSYTYLIGRKAAFPAERLRCRIRRIFLLQLKIHFCSLSHQSTLNNPWWWHDHDIKCKSFNTQHKVIYLPMHPDFIYYFGVVHFANMHNQKQVFHLYLGSLYHLYLLHLFTLLFPARSGVCVCMCVLTCNNWPI